MLVYPLKFALNIYQLNQKTQKMKKVLISAALVCLAGLTYAQKPVAGDVTGDVELRLQTGGDYIHVLSPNLNARYFLKDDLALRLSLGVNTSSSSQDYTENADGTGGTGKQESSKIGRAHV